jgi:Spy/CpxP family protein refolding chaperone
MPLTAAAALILPVSALAQQAPSTAAPYTTQQWQRNRSHRGGFMRMFRNLNLSDQQKSQIHTIMQQYRQEHPRGSQPDPQARKQMRDQIINVLTPQQRTQLQQEMQQQRQRHQEQEQQPAPQATPQA